MKRKYSLPTIICSFMVGVLSTALLLGWLSWNNQAQASGNEILPGLSFECMKEGLVRYGSNTTQGVNNKYQVAYNQPACSAAAGFHILGVSFIGNRVYVTYQR